MNTLLISEKYPPVVGGTASFAANITRHWPTERGNLFVLTAKDKSKTKKEITSVKIYRGSFQPFLFFFKLAYIILKEKITCLQTHEVVTVAWPVNLACFLFRLPARIIFHSRDFNRLKNSSYAKFKIKRLCKRTRAIFVNSYYLQSEFKRHFENLNIEPKVIYPCPSQIFFDKKDPDQISQLKKKLALEGKKIILTIASLSEGKGYPRLISCLPKILQKIPNLCWLIVGDGPKKADFIKMIQQNNLQNIIRYLGLMPQENLPIYYQLADLFVLLTHPDNEAEEDWGTVFVEASASARPVLAGQVGGIEEAVVNLKTGLVVDISQPNAIINTMTDLLTQTEFARSLGLAGQEWVKQNFAWDKEILKLWD
ncbi:MAG: hypothetical protein COU31_00645 [Candidatus Magasanikbacteria bacterium CG10_big_fil_rev_8_21_14_0_10_40_10]|uniref:Glycosyl transferase family 1 domain-containing protein n=1 Tax=Candidatus Magasanikbacteria bacterium CG10_big_fil_rev_8_21_14_0_10_40_10 TaxID=1974648 RepID=A0A2M6W4W0_9BACT|nr:MAG: hypothetical protein COU31_00645 [Candidatus Magasanikbacteria bacterium CG10_big_fil_rev_8_21_14_0_10_40_10]